MPLQPLHPPLSLLLLLLLLQIQDPPHLGCSSKAWQQASYC
jgi:hypothetical protein